MRDRHAGVRSVLGRTRDIALFLVSVPTLAWGVALTPEQLLALMIESQGANAEFIGLVFGPDGGAPLAFTSNVDPSGTSFSFALAPTSYRGQSLALNATGLFNPATDVLQLSSAGSFGSQSFATVGTSAVTLSSENVLQATADVDFFLNGVKEADGETVVFERSNGDVADFGFATDKDGNEIPGSRRVSSGTKNPKPKWSYATSVALGFFIVSEGSSPVAGGPGTFVTIILPEPVPEPSALVLLGSAMAGLALARTRRTKRPAAQPGAGL